ncbi:hypothetical protein F5148DRAFT_866884 [Russula earlei]|uniref:Uncharacterized protein n=1 Tax=Russula earlei TaxID=71964 RepID=A0ACC0UAL8_9AGAM|nr:hypothetical protein F5148DRAFT_866884 [Russula earlei]
MGHHGMMMWPPLRRCGVWTIGLAAFYWWLPIGVFPSTQPRADVRTCCSVSSFPLHPFRVLSGFSVIRACIRCRQWTPIGSSALYLIRRRDSRFARRGIHPFQSEGRLLLVLRPSPVASCRVNDQV